MLYAKFQELLRHFGFQMQESQTLASLTKALDDQATYCVIQNKVLDWYLPKSLGLEEVQARIDQAASFSLNFEMLVSNDPKLFWCQVQLDFTSYESFLPITHFLISGLLSGFLIEKQSYVFPEILTHLAGQDDSLDVAELISHIKNDLVKNPDNAILYNYLGKTLMAGENPDAGSPYFTLACEKNPYYGEPYSNMGALMWLSGLKEKAFDLFSEAMLRNPFDVSFQDNFIKAGIELGNIKQMNDILNKVAEYYPEFSELNYLKGLLLMRMGNLSESATVLKDILQRQPGDQRAQNLLMELQKQD